MEWTPTDLREPRQTVSCTFTYHTWRFIIFTIFTITACIYSYSISISFWTQDLALPQILSSIHLFLDYRTDYTRTLWPSNDFTLLNSCTGKCVRLSRLLVGFRMHFKSLHCHSFIHFYVEPHIRYSAYVLFSRYTIYSSTGMTPRKASEKKLNVH